MNSLPQIKAEIWGTVKSLLLGMCFVLGACTSQTSTVQTTEKGTQWEWQNGTIVVKTPERPAGQKSVLGTTSRSWRQSVWVLLVWVCVAPGSGAFHLYSGYAGSGSL